MQNVFDRLQRTLGTNVTVRLGPMPRSLLWDLYDLNEEVIHNISQLESEGQWDYHAIRLHCITPTLKLLRNLRSLKVLNLSGTRITDDGLHLLSRCHTQVKIFLRSCVALTDVNSLYSIATLEEIDLSGCTSLTHVGTLGTLPALKEVDLSGTRVTNDEIGVLSESRTLVKIYLQCCGALTNVNPLYSIATLEEIDLSRCTWINRVGALGTLPALKELDLSDTPITDVEVHSLASFRQQLGLPPIYVMR